jgi:Sulfatase
MHTLNLRQAFTQIFFILILMLGASFALAATAHAQAPQDRSVLPPAPAFKGSIGDTYKDSPLDWTPALPLTAPEGAPNILLVVLDDVGYGHLGSYGGPIDTPHLDKLAAGGLRYNNFHTTALCC